MRHVYADANMPEVIRAVALEPGRLGFETPTLHYYSVLHPPHLLAPAVQEGRNGGPSRQVSYCRTVTSSPTPKLLKKTRTSRATTMSILPAIHHLASEA